jgi:hypothetical protein
MSAYRWQSTGSQAYFLELSVISNRERGANVHRTMCGRHFFWCFWLSRKMHGSFIAIIRDKTWRFFETHSAQGATHIHIPRSGRVLGLSAQSVRHVLK